jgi:polysaccharide export outer membrane protein
MKRVIHVLGLTGCLGFFLLASSCTLKDLPRAPETPPTGTDVYRIGPEDRLRIDVWKQPNMSAVVPVRSDGKISIPLVPDIQAAGLTPVQLKDKITTELSKLIGDPTVSVIVEEINSLKISVAGSVRKPGVYKIGKQLSIIEAISLAGGLEPMADARRIRLIRRQDGTENIYQVDYNAIVNGDIKQNIFLMPGDTVVVP